MLRSRRPFITGRKASSFLPLVPHDGGSQQAVRIPARTWGHGVLLMPRDPRPSGSGESSDHERRRSLLSLLSPREAPEVHVSARALAAGDGMTCRRAIGNAAPLMSRVPATSRVGDYRRLINSILCTSRPSGPPLQPERDIAASDGHTLELRRQRARLACGGIPVEVDARFERDVTRWCLTDHGVFRAKGELRGKRGHIIRFARRGCALPLLSRAITNTVTGPETLSAIVRSSSMVPASSTE